MTIEVASSYLTFNEEVSLMPTFVCSDLWKDYVDYMDLKLPVGREFRPMRWALSCVDSVTHLPTELETS